MSREDAYKSIETPGYPRESRNSRKLTFAGVLQDYWWIEIEQGKNIGISKNWNKDTRKDYTSDYLNRVLPNLGWDKALEDYKKEDLDKAIEQIFEGKPPADITLARYRRHIRVVFEMALKQGIITENIIWGSAFSAVTSNYTKESQAIRLRLRKSLAPKEEIDLLQTLLNDFLNASGQRAGLLLMFFLGLRNQEVPALIYGDIRQMSETSEGFKVLVYKSIDRQTNTVQPSGKTPNAVRVVPVPAALHFVMNKRREHIETILGSSQGNEEIDSMSLPIACKGLNYYQHCSLEELEKAALQLVCPQSLYQPVS